MDAKDVRIFCEMGFKYFDYSGINRRPSPKQIGQKLGLDEKTVRLRTRKMEREGFIQYYQVVPNVSLFGQSLACIYGFQADSVSAKQQALHRLLEENYVLDAMDFLGEMFGVTLTSSSEQEAQEIAKTFSEQTGTRCFPFIPPRRFPSSQVSLNELDWQLIKALRYNALRPTKEIARS